MKIILGVLLASSYLVAERPDPRKEGPYPVGVTTTVIVDNSRTDALTNKPRTLVTEVWYPADDKAKTMSTTKFHDFFPGGITAEMAPLIAAGYRQPLEDLDK